MSAPAQSFGQIGQTLSPRDGLLPLWHCTARVPKYSSEMMARQYSILEAQFVEWHLLACGLTGVGGFPFPFYGYVRKSENEGGAGHFKKIK